MNERPKHRLRAAAAICDQLNRQSPSRSNAQLPQEAWSRLAAAVKRHNVADSRGWQTAKRLCQIQLRVAINRLCEELEAFRAALAEAPKQPILLGDLIADLGALEQEFAAVEFGLRDRTIRVTTEPVELEGIDLGPFEIVLSYRQLGERTDPYHIVATEPYLANGDGCPHPHVQSEQLCAGEGQAAIRTALEQGRLLDFFLLVRQVLRTYNPDSAYTRLDEWQGVDCRDCGEHVGGENAYCCEPCDSDLCRGCAISCEDCDQYCCDDCSQECHGCDLAHCRSCLKTCSACQQSCCDNCLDNQSKPGVCNACLEKEKAKEVDVEPQAEPRRETETAESATAAVHPLRLGQAQLPAGCG